MPDPSSPGTRAGAILLVLALSLAALAPAASALDTSTRAIKVMGSQTYNPQTIQTYAGEVDGGPPAFDGQGSVIAVLDTGIDDQHPTFQGAWQAGAEVLSVCGSDEDCVRDTQANGEPGHNPDDSNGHGTHVASIALGRGAPAQDGGPAIPAGVAPGARLVEVKIASDLTGSTIGKIADGIEWVIKYNDGDTAYGLPTRPVNVISLSFSGSPQNGEDAKDRDAAMEAIRAATQAGILVVVSAGNCGPEGGGVSLTCSGPGRERNGITTPGAAPEALTVGAIDDQDSVTRNGDVVAGYSSRGPNPATSSSDTLWRKPDVVAPGSRIEAACHASLPGDQRGRADQLCSKTGTSMAAPHVAGLAAIMFQAGRFVRDEGFTPQEVKSLITSTATDWEEPGWDPVSGHGYVDGYQALVKAVNQAPEARFSFSPRTPHVGQEIILDASLADDPDDQDTLEAFAWTFGDGTPALETGPETRTVHHTYDEVGTYTITLTVTDSRGATDTMTRTVNVEEAPPEDLGEKPKAAIDWWPDPPTTGQPVVLDASNTTDPDKDAIVKYEWDIDHVDGDFEPDIRTGEAKVNWTFERKGAHRVMLRVVDARGLSDEVSRVLRVNPPPPGPPDVRFTHPQEGDQLQPGPLLTSWIVHRNPASSFTLYVDGRQDATTSARQVRIDVAEGTHTLRLVATGPGGRAVAWVNFTATDEPLEPQSADPAASCTTHTHSDGSTEQHCPNQQAAQETCITHVHGDGQVEEHCGTPDELPTDDRGRPAATTDQAGTDETPLGAWLALAAVLLASLIARRRAPR